MNRERGGGLERRERVFERFLHATPILAREAQHSPDEDFPRERRMTRLVVRDPTHRSADTSIAGLGRLPCREKRSERLFDAPLDRVIFEELEERRWRDPSRTRTRRSPAEPPRKPSHCPRVTALVVR